MNFDSNYAQERYYKIRLVKLSSQTVSLETDADKMRLGFSKFVTILLMIMLIGKHMLKIETLTIPKW